MEFSLGRTAGSGVLLFFRRNRLPKTAIASAEAPNSVIIMPVTSELMYLPKGFGESLLMASLRG